MRNVLRLAATAAVILMACPSYAATPVVDGTISAGEYGAPTATVATDLAAPTGNFQTPGNTATAGYGIYLNDTNDTLFGAVSQTGGNSAGSFVNLYFDIDPATGSGGSDLGIEVTNKLGFVPGTAITFDLSSRINIASITTMAGLTTTEFSIANSVFRDYIAGAAAQNFFGPGGYVPQNVRLNLSQSLSYSVAGGASYGAARLGSFDVAAVPEPATWAMMLVGFGGIGFALRRGKRSTRTAAAFA